MLSLIFYSNALIAALACITLGIVGLPFAAFVFCTYAILCIIISTVCADE